MPVVVIATLTSGRALSHYLRIKTSSFVDGPIDQTRLATQIQSVLQVHRRCRRLTSFGTRLRTGIRRHATTLRRLLFRSTLARLPDHVDLLSRINKLLRRRSLGFTLTCLSYSRFGLIGKSFNCTIDGRLLRTVTRQLQTRLHPASILTHVKRSRFYFLLRPISTTFSLDR